MNKKYLTFLLLLLIIAKFTQAQKPTLFLGATAHLGNGEKIENAENSENRSKSTQT